MRTIRELGPLGVVVGLVSVVTWVLLDAGDAAGEWLLAGLLLAHGLVHLMYLMPMPSAGATTAPGPTWPFDLARSWLAPRLDPRTIRRMGGVLVALTIGCAALGALAIVGIVVPSGWWATLVVGAAVSSLSLLAIGYSPSLLLGIAIDVALLWLALGSGWAPIG